MGFHLHLIGFREQQRRRAEAEGGKELSMERLQDARSENTEKEADLVSKAFGASSTSPPSSLSSKVQAERAEEIRTAFAVFDQDGDGSLTRDEFVQAMTLEKAGSPMSPEKATRMFDAADKSGDGVVDYNEFVSAWMQKSLRPPQWVDP